MKVLLLTFIFLIPLYNVFGQQNQKKINDLQKELESIQTEINQLEKKLQSTQKKLNAETGSLENLDKQITLGQKQIRVYQSEIRQKNQNVQRLEIQVQKLKEKIAHLKKVFMEQILFAFKYQRGKHLDWLLGASNLTDMVVRYRYFQLVSKAEKSNYLHLQEMERNLNNSEKKLVGELASVKNLLSDSKKAQSSLQKKRRNKSSLISKIKKNKILTERALNQRRESRRKLLNLIANLEKERPTRKLKTATQIKWEKLTGSFRKNRGKLNWPVRGKILHGFGKYRNPQLKTVLNNSGIDIRAQRGTGVRCVFPGVVSLITYMSGFGNTIIIDHNDGYYTVYSHLDEVLVNNEDFLEGGTIIGTVGETGSLEGAKLHFEIYGSNKPLSPNRWLRK